MLLPWNNWKMKSAKRLSPTAFALLFGTFLLRVNGGASSLMVGRFLAQLVPLHGHPITSIEVGLFSVTYFILELALPPVMGGLRERCVLLVLLTLGPLFGLMQFSLLF